ncbi:MAG TPA: TIGR00341 family protein [Chloroflexi bacterium]|nr:TIGR00341 family protein [Chloroflexota bacterium]
MNEKDHETDLFSQIRFSRGLGFWQVTSHGTSVIVVAILFVLLGDAAAVAGSLTPLALLLTALLVGVNAPSYAKLAVDAVRPGGAYVQVQQAQKGWLAFLTGWTLILSGLGLSALLVKGFAIQTTTLLHDYLGLALDPWPWAAGLVMLLAVNNALGTWRGRHGLLVALSLFTLVGFAMIAAPHITTTDYVAANQDWRHGITLLMAAFVGLEVTTSLQNEMRQQKKNIPRSLLLTLGLSAGLGMLVVAVAIGVVGPEMLTDSPTALAAVGERIAEGAGRPLILILGILALPVAVNSMLMVVVRQIYVMSKDGYWPPAMRHLDPRFKTPSRIIFLTTLLLLPLIWLPTDFVSHLVSLLYLLVLVTLNLILAARPQRTPSPFVLPFHPWIPGIALAIDVLILPLWHPIYLAWAAGCLAVGTLIYVLYARTHHIEAQTGVTVFKPPSQERAESKYRVLVPIANPATAGTLLRLAGVLARHREGRVLALQVTVVPDQIPLEEGRHRAAAGRTLLERAVEQARAENFEIETMTRVAHSVAQGILDTAREENIALILMGWRGDTRSFSASMGPVIDAVIRDAPCDVTVVKGDGWSGAAKILVPAAGGPHAPIAAQLALTLSEAEGAKVTALYVQLGRATPEQMELNKQRLAQTFAGLEFSHPLQQKVVVADSIVEGIIREAAGYDLVLLGASEEGMLDQFVFGSIPQQIAARVPKTAIIVRGYGGPTEFWIRKLTRGLLHLLPRLNAEEQLGLRETMSTSARPNVNYFVLIVLSCIIATLGLLLDSAAVVIGAMLVAPLMSPILAFSLGIVLGDVRLIRLSIEAVFKGVALATIIAIFIGILSPLKELTGEIMARTQPNLLDLTVALASGMAGAYALARKDVSAALPGVAIAAALMPPLGVVGLGLALGEPRVAGGAFLLFITNIASISLAGAIIFLLLGVHPDTWRPEAQQHVRRGLVGITFLLLIIAIPLGIVMRGDVRDTARRQTAHQILHQRLSATGSELVHLEIEHGPTGITISATVRAVTPLDQDTVDELVTALTAQLEQPVQLELVVLPTIHSATFPQPE